MKENRWSRRSLLTTLPGMVIGIAGNASGAKGQSVRWSSGTERPKAKLPAGATDCHFHIYDSRYPVDPKAVLRPGNATVKDYRALQRRLGSTRGVIVQPSTYGTDNRLLLDVLREFGTAGMRGVAVVDTSVTDAELKRLHAGGVRGIRFNLVFAGATTLDMVDPLAKRIAHFGWHIQVYATADQIVAAKELWNRVPCPVVYDHLGHIPEPQGTSHPAFGVICGLLQKGKAWVKLSGFYYDSRIGPPSYADSVAIARAFVREAPDRLLWGSDWPHPTITEGEKPDDALLLDLTAGCMPDETTRNRIFGTNATEVYGLPNA